MPKPKPPEVAEEANEQEESPEPIPGHPTWSGSISIGLVNIPVRAIPITVDKKVSFRMLHQKCKTPISYRIFCQEGDEVPKSEIAYGYRLKGHEYLVFDKKEGENLLFCNITKLNIYLVIISLRKLFIKIVVIKHEKLGGMW